MDLRELAEQMRAKAETVPFKINDALKMPMMAATGPYLSKITVQDIPITIIFTKTILAPTRFFWLLSISPPDAPKEIIQIVKEAFLPQGVPAPDFLHTCVKFWQIVT